MRNDELFSSEPRGNQLELSGMYAPGEEDYCLAKEWIRKNPKAYQYMKDNAVRLYRRSGYVSINYLVNMVRNELHVSVKNALAPAFARIIEEDVPELSGGFKKHAARVDGFV